MTLERRNHPAPRVQKCALMIMLVLALLLTACGGLGGEPQIVATRVLPTPTAIPAQTSSLPDTPPRLSNGARIFIENCTACHGIDGSGQGQLVLDGQVPNPGNFRDPQQVTLRTPREWYNVITNGRIENLMPPWRDALSEQERWDVAMYTYTMHYTADQLLDGERLYQECSECHGLEGRGDGPEAANNPRDVRDLTDQEAMVTLSDGSLYNIIAEGYPDVMPAYGEIYDEDDLWSVVAFTRILHLADDAVQVISSEQPDSAEIPSAAQAVTQAATPADDPLPTLNPAQPLTTTLDITGTITNRTADGPVPPGLAVTLLVFGPDQRVIEDLTREVQSDESGSFVFEQVTIRDDAFYLATVDYQGRGFPSEFAQGNPAATSLMLPIDIYELTDDPDVVTVRAQVSQISVIGDSVEVQYTVQHRNSSDRIYTSLEEEQESGRFLSIAIPLPPGATVLSYDQPNRYLFNDAQDIVYDTLPLLPGEERFSQIFYVVQYGGGAVIEYPTVYSLDGQVRLLMETPTISVSGEQFPPVGEQTIGGVSYQEYGRRLTLGPGSLIRYELTGTPAEAVADVNATTLQPVTGEGLTVLLVVIAAVFALVILLIVIFSRRRASPEANRDLLIDALVRQIAELDAQHERGEINHDVYQRRRSTLKVRLAELMDGGQIDE
jgi:mono/diheme cytochrome c family protein/uncharacterized membrane protein